MGKGGHGVSGHTHTQAQLDHYANQNNPNNDAYHDLRHSTASILVDKGWDINDIKEWLGHSDIATTANIYAHKHRRIPFSI